MLPALIPAVNVAKAILSKVVMFVKDKVSNNANNVSTISKIAPMAIPIVLVLIIGSVVFSNLDSISNKLGFETKQSLALKVQQEEHNTDTVIEANKHTQEAIGAIVAANKVNADLTEDLHKEINETIKQVNDIDNKTNKKVVEITKVKTTTDIQKKQEISKTNIAAIWDSYCSFNQDSECSKAAA